jgi:hypothetical protein
LLNTRAAGGALGSCKESLTAAIRRKDCRNYAPHSNCAYWNMTCISLGKRFEQWATYLDEGMSATFNAALMSTHDCPSADDAE